VEGSNYVGNERGQAPRCFIPLCFVRFGSEQIGREGSAAASSGVIGPGFVERTVAALAYTGALSITIALSNIIIAIVTAIIIVVIIIITILLALDPRQRQVDEYPLLLPPASCDDASRVYSSGDDCCSGAAGSAFIVVVVVVRVRISALIALLAIGFVYEEGNRYDAVVRGVGEAGLPDEACHAIVINTGNTDRNLFGDGFWSVLVASLPITN